MPGYKKFRVVGHDLEALGTSVRLNLLMEDGTGYSMPGLDRKKLKVYPDYYEFKNQQEQREQTLLE